MYDLWNLIRFFLQEYLAIGFGSTKFLQLVLVRVTATGHTDSNFLCIQNAMTFLSRYEAVDIVKVKIDGNSRSIWGISPPSRHAMLNDLLSDNPITVRVEWQFTRLVHTLLMFVLWNFIAIELHFVIRPKLGILFLGMQILHVTVLLSIFHTIQNYLQVAYQLPFA